jgi:hypothetical protein
MLSVFKDFDDTHRLKLTTEDVESLSGEFSLFLKKFFKQLGKVK